MSKGSSFQQGISFGFRLGVEMLVSIAVGALIGYGLDRLFETAPWLLAIFILFGGAAGCLTVYRTAATLQQEEEQEIEEPKDRDANQTSTDQPHSDRKL